MHRKLLSYFSLLYFPAKTFSGLGGERAFFSCDFCNKRRLSRRAKNVKVGLSGPFGDRQEQLAAVVKAARAAGATGIWANLLNLRPGTREHFLENLARDWPEELPRYERLYANGRAYLKKQEAQPVRSEVTRLAREHRVRDRRRVKLEPPLGPEQLALTL